MTKSTYMTLGEMRDHPERVLASSISKKGGTTRFEGSTVPEFALEFIPTEGPVLELGPIRGDFTKFLQDHGYRDIHAVDFVDLLEFPDRDRVTMHELDLNRDTLPYPDNFFHGAAAWGLGEHLENPFHFAREVARVLKPGAVFIFSLPNVFHIISRLIFLKRGMFPRWSYANNHISLLPRGVFDKTILRDFELVETRYVKPRLMLWFLDRFSRWLPANQWFGDYVVYILKKRRLPDGGVSDGPHVS